MSEYIKQIISELDKPPLNNFGKLQEFKDGKIFGCIFDAEWSDNTNGSLIIFDLESPMIYDIDGYKSHAMKLMKESMYYGFADKYGWHV